MGLSAVDDVLKRILRGSSVCLFSKVYDFCATDLGQYYLNAVMLSREGSDA